MEFGILHHSFFRKLLYFFYSQKQFRDVDCARPCLLIFNDCFGKTLPFQDFFRLLDFVFCSHHPVVETQPPPPPLQLAQLLQLLQLLKQFLAPPASPSPWQVEQLKEEELPEAHPPQCLPNRCHFDDVVPPMQLSEDPSLVHQSQTNRMNACTFFFKPTSIPLCFICKCTLLLFCLCRSSFSSFRSPLRSMLSSERQKKKKEHTPHPPRGQR